MGDTTDNRGRVGRRAEVLLLDNHWITTIALRTSLTTADGLRLVAEAADCDEAAAAVSAELPDVIVFTDANDPAVVFDRIMEVAPHWPVKAVMLGGNGIPAPLALRCSATGSLPWNAGEQEVLSAVRLVAAGHSISARHRGRTVTEPGPRRLGMEYHDYALTTRESDVLLLLSKGYTNAEISALLGLGESTVKSHVQNLLNKLGVRNRVEATVYTYETGLVQPGGTTRFSA